MQGTCCFYHKRWYGVKYGEGVFRKGTITNNDLYENRRSQILTQINGCNILLSHNLWFIVKEIKTEHGLQQYLINRKKSQVQSQ